MGGQAFSSKQLYMPRMPTKVYHRVLSEIHNKLETIYAQVGTPLEGPAKIDHGDVDYLVVARDSNPDPNPADVATVLGATYHHRTPNSATTHFAIAWPYEAHEEPTSPVPQSSPPLPRFIQVDVLLCPNPASYTYALFHKAHGDMWTILGAMLRRYGFISTPEGFHIRIEALETYNKKLSRVKLSDDPDTVLRYLGLSVERYNSVFRTWDEAMDYAATCRFHDPTRGQQYDLDAEVDVRLELKAHDRSKAHKRAMFQYFLAEYLPKHRGGRVGSACKMNRDEVVEDVKAFFGAEVAREFDERKEKWVAVRDKEKFWGEVRKGLPCEGAELTVAMRGLKSEIAGVGGEGLDGDGEGVDGVRRAFREARYEDARLWVDEHWEDVLRRQQLRDREQSTRNFLARLEKMRVAEDEEGGGDSEDAQTSEGG